MEWVPVTNFPNYEVSYDGRVRNRNTLTVLRPQMHKPSGFLMVFLRRSGVQHTKYIHRLVAEAFLHPADYGRTPVHIDGDRENNHADNLEWRSLSIAREMTMDANKVEPTENRRVMNKRTGIIYNSPLDAARDIGGIERYVILAAYNQSSYKGGIWTWY